MSVFALQTNLDFDTVSACRDDLLALLDETPEGLTITLEMGALKQVDSSGLQLLLTFWHAAAERGNRLSLLNPPESLTKTLDMLKLSDRFFTA